jgi:hypothetical protein
VLWRFVTDMRQLCIVGKVVVIARRVNQQAEPAGETIALCVVDRTSPHPG